MKKIKIGLPRALTYHRYGILWKTFFTTLGCKVIISPETTKDIINLGINNASNECCLPYKIYLGHAIYLSNYCDYILVSRICNYGKNNEVCPQLYATYDYLKSIISKNKILDYSICYSKFKYEFLFFFKIGFKITKNPLKIIYSYLLSKKKQKKYNQEKINEENNKFYKALPKVLLLSPFYNLEDKFISRSIINYLKEENIISIYSNHIDKKIATLYAEYFSDVKYWQYSKEMIGALYYYNHQIDGVIYINTTNCSIDAIINHLVHAKNSHLPTINIVIDENFDISKINLELKKFIIKVKESFNES